MKKWILRGCSVQPENISRISKDMGISTLAAQLLAIRGFSEVEDVKSYFNLSVDNLHSPKLMKDLTLACEMLLDAIDEGKEIAVFGDYDADGITSTSIMTMVLRRLGGKVRFYIPRRDTEGYGLNSPAIEKLAAEGVEVLLTVDNGISALEQVALAKSLGMTVIIADHHEVPYELLNGEMVYVVPDADAVIDPKQEDCPYPFKSLCAGTIAYKLAQELYEMAGANWDADHYEYLTLATIATICDIMELTDENRNIVKFGLSKMHQSGNLGLDALLAANNIETVDITTYHIGFVLGPCINASGRLEVAEIAVELFLSQDEARAKELAAHMVGLNSDRKHLSSEGVEDVNAQILAEGLENDKVILVHLPTLPESIAGIVAGRIKEMYNRPAFILAGEKDIAKGSGRSVEGFNMFNALVECKDMLHVFGGHYMATGLSVAKENIPALRKALNDNCDMELEDMLPVTYIDMALPIEKADNNMSLANFLENMAPFGRSNAAPLFGDRDVPISRIQILGASGQIVKYFFQNRCGNGVISAISFRKRDEFYDMVVDYGGKDLWYSLIDGNNSSNLSLDIIYAVEINEYHDVKKVQLQIKDLRLHKRVK